MRQLDGIRNGWATKPVTAIHFANSSRSAASGPVSPGRANRKKRIRHDKQAYEGRNVIERCYCRLKDFRHTATCNDKLA